MSDSNEHESNPYLPLTDAKRVMNLWRASRRCRVDGSAEAFNDEIKALKASGRASETLFTLFAIVDWMWAKGLAPTDAVLQELDDIVWKQGVEARTLWEDIQAVSTQTVAPPEDGGETP